MSTPRFTPDGLLPDRPPELLAPGGSLESIRAAAAAGADAVYFGLTTGWNARRRAANVEPSALGPLVAELHRRGMRAYLALNTLVFNDELGEAERAVRLAIESGVDALMVQDLGLARLIRAVSPDVPIHASTQMTLACAESIRAVEPLGIQRVVLPRELSLGEIAMLARSTRVELEVFVHGALCLSYGGQCLASAAIGGRSANRGQCAQPCRLPYSPRLEGCPAARLPAPYPLSPNDLAAWRLVPELLRAGVAALKIEGRLKSAEYVARATRLYRRAIDAAMAGRVFDPEPGELDELDVRFSRGTCEGWLPGRGQRAIITGESSAHRGVRLGVVRGVAADRVAVALERPVRRGDGLMFPAGDAPNPSTARGRKRGDSVGAPRDIGGKVYEVFVEGRSLPEAAAGQVAELSFRRSALELRRLRPGRAVYKTSDARGGSLGRLLGRDGWGGRRVAVDIVVEAAVGRPLRLTAQTTTGFRCELGTSQPLAAAEKHAIDESLLRTQLGRLGRTAYRLGRLELRATGRPMIPFSTLGALRREMVRRLDAQSARSPWTLRPAPAIDAFHRADATLGATAGNNRPLPAGHTCPDGSTTELGGPLAESAGRAAPPPVPSRRADSPARSCSSEAIRPVVLVRRFEQLEAALDCGIGRLIADLADVHSWRRAVGLARAAGAEIWLASPRVQKPGEREILRRLVAAEPDGLLARHLAAVEFCGRRGVSFVADASLPTANSLGLSFLLSRGAVRVTPAFELSVDQIVALAATLPPERLEVIVHEYPALFHTEYCFVRAISSASEPQGEGVQARQQAGDRGCRRACWSGRLRWLDRTGAEHPVARDAACRNTIFAAVPRRIIEAIPRLVAVGVRDVRIELSPDTPGDQVRAIVQPYLVRRVV